MRRIGFPPTIEGAIRDDPERVGMTKSEWWTVLDWETKDWITRHLGEVLPADIAAKVAAAGGGLVPARFLGSERAAYQLRPRDVRRILRGAHVLDGDREARAS
jgi:hypothetical protein